MTETESITLIRRADIPDLRSVVVDGRTHPLGLLKDFAKIPEVKAFIPPAARLSISWVRLDGGEELEAHSHPISSMIVVAAGSGRTQDGVAFGDGDIMLIPGGVRHGYVGTGEGYWALAIQFEVRGLYEDPDRALVAFGDADGPIESVDGLLAANARFGTNYRNSRLFRLLASGRLDVVERRRRLLDVSQVISTNFQRALLARSAFPADPRYEATFRAHLAAEFGHDAALRADRDWEPEVPWDAVLEATTSWFVQQVLALDDPARVVLVHLVLEAASGAISEVGADVFPEGSETDYFVRHLEADEEHQRLGVELLADLGPGTYAHLADVQAKGWKMITAACDRMAELADPAFS